VPYIDSETGGFATGNVYVGGFPGGDGDQGGFAGGPEDFPGGFPGASGDDGNDAPGGTADSEAGGRKEDDGSEDVVDVEYTVEDDAEREDRTG
jgi:UPF0716 protein FxsA